jgi:hypothetical protein
MVAMVAVALMLAAIPFAGTYLYFWVWRGYYFPDRYEAAFQALALSALASVVVLVACVSIAIASYRRQPRRK